MSPKSLRSLLMFALAAPALALPAVAEDAAPPGRQLAGTVTYLPRVALPDDARLQLEARSPFGDSYALVETPTEGAQVPLAFSVTVPQSRDLQLAIALLSGPDTLWVSGLVDVAAGDEDTKLAPITLRSFTPFGADYELLCGKARYRVGFSGEDALLELPLAGVPLSIQVSASGARFASADGRYEVWTKGGSALVTLDGADLGECTFVPPAPDEEWIGRGQEPGWTARVAGGRLSLTRQSGDGVEAALTLAGIRDGAYHYTGSDAAGTAIEVALTPGICRDSMSGMPHPQALTLRLGEEELSGCGGAPLSLLTGPEWVVEDLQGKGIIDNSHMTLQVGTGGQVAGSGGCNRYFGNLTLSGEGLRIGPLGSTMMACAEALMEQENRLHTALAAVDSFDLDDTGALELRSGGEVAVLLRR